MKDLAASRLAASASLRLALESWGRKVHNSSPKASSEDHLYEGHLAPVSALIYFINKIRILEKNISCVVWTCWRTFRDMMAKGNEVQEDVQWCQVRVYFIVRRMKLAFFSAFWILFILFYLYLYLWVFLLKLCWLGSTSISKFGNLFRVDLSTWSHWPGVCPEVLAPS